MKDAAMEFTDDSVPNWNQPYVACIVGENGFRSGEAAPDAVSAYELSELVSGALEDAMLAASHPCAETYLYVLEVRKRDDILERMKDLPAVQLSHPVVHAEVQNELAMMRAQKKLAVEIVKGIRSYARSKRLSVVSAMA